MIMIKEAYVSFETAKLLKDKGFPQDPCICNTIYKPKGEFSINAKSFWNPFAASLLGREYFMAPTQQMAMQWLREVHDIHFDITPQSWVYPETIEHLTGWAWSIFKGRPFDCLYAHMYREETYERAVESALNYALNNLV